MQYEKQELFDGIPLDFIEGIATISDYEVWGYDYALHEAFPLTEHATLDDAVREKITREIAEDIYRTNKIFYYVFNKNGPIELITQIKPNGRKH